MISKFILNLFVINVCANVYENVKLRQGSNGYITEHHENNNVRYYEDKNNFRVSYESHMNSMTSYKVDNNTPTNMRPIDGDNLDYPKRYNNNTNNVDGKYRNTTINMKNNVENGSVTTDQPISKTEEEIFDSVSAQDDLQRDFYSNITVNSKRIKINKIDGKVYSYAGEYKYVEGELAHFKCDRYQSFRTRVVYNDKFNNSILFSDDVEAYIRLQAIDNPLKIQCLTMIIYDNVEPIYFITDLYLLPQKKKHTGPHFVVNGLTLPIMRQQTSWFKETHYYDSEYYNYLDENLDISITKSSEFEAASCNLILYPAKELINVTYNSDTISLKPHSFALSCEFNNSQTKPYNLALYSKAKKYNHLPLLNSDKEQKFENFTNTEPCIYGLYWSKILAKYNKMKNHVHIRYQYGIDQEFIKIVGVSRRNINVQYDPIEVSIKKVPIQGNPLLINWNNITYRAYQYKVVLKENFNKTSITFQSSGQYTVELIKGVQQKAEKMLIFKRKNSDEVIETKSDSIGLPETADGNKAESSEDIMHVDTAAENVITNGSQKGTSIVEIVTITVSSLLILIIIVLGIIGAKQVLQGKKNRREPEVTVAYNCRQSEHVYETIDYSTIGAKPSSPDIKQRPPHPLPPEALEENQLVYDSPYDFRIFPT